MPSFIQNSILTLFLLCMIFLGFLYYLGSTDPRILSADSGAYVEEVLVDGEWVRYRIDSDNPPGEILIYDDGPHSNPVFIAGLARSAWFSNAAVAPAQVIAADNTVLWEGTAKTDERHIYDMVLPFIFEADVGNYEGEAVFIMYQGEELNQANEDYFFARQISIVKDDTIEFD